MLLLNALRLGETPRLALVGAGGKTSALFRLGREYLEQRSNELIPQPARTVFLAATTHLAVEQLQLADQHIVIREDGRHDLSKATWPEGLVLFTGPPERDNRTSGLSLDFMQKLLNVAEESQFPLFVEADGSRQRPLKAPASHEPVIPAWVDTVVTVAGLSGIRKPLTAEWVHRPERFSDLAGISLGQAISPDALERVLNHPAGGLKGIPAGARRVALLNQADIMQLQAEAQRLATGLLKAYEAVIIAALSPPAGMNDSGRVMGGKPEDRSVLSVNEPVAGVVLAGGGASRFGQVKQTLPWRGHELVWHVSQAAIKAGLSPVVVVTGNADTQVRAALGDLPVAFVHNPDWSTGQSSSIAAGLRALPTRVGSAVFLLADQPRVPTALVRSLIDSHASTLAPIVAPLIQNQRANPVLFDRITFPALHSLSGDVGGRQLFSHYSVAWLPWDDPGVVLDIDTPSDYQTLLESPFIEGEQ